MKKKEKLVKTAVELMNIYAPEKNLNEKDIINAEGCIEEKRGNNVITGVRTITIYPTKDGREKMNMGKEKVGLRSVDPDSFFARLVKVIHGDY